MFDHLIKYLTQGDSRLRSQLHREKMSTNRSVTEADVMSFLIVERF